MTLHVAPPHLPTTLGGLRTSGWISRPVKEELRRNAIAKIAGVKMCESYNRQYGRDYRSVMPTNLYGPGDNYHPENSHVVPALIRRFHEAKIKNLKMIIIKFLLIYIY